MLKIVLTGPESSGKTTLAQQLAGHFGVAWAPEFSRQYLDELGRPYRQDDLLDIARGQIAREEFFTSKTGELLFLDTSLEVIKVWSDFKYGHCHPWILEQWQLRTHDFYLLCRPDLPWIFDPQRENPGELEVLFEMYKRDLTALGVNFFEIQGREEKRFQLAVRSVVSFLKKTVSP